MEAHREHLRTARRAYNRVFWVLAVLTAIELALGLEAARVLPGAVVVILLLALAATKASLVALYYMHLRYDNKLLAGIFIVPLMFAVMLAAFAVLAR